MAVFAAASVAGGVGSGVVVLVVLRVVKGGCAALTAPAGLAIVNEVFPEGPERRRAVAVYASFGAVGFTTGLLLAGLLVEESWRWAFVFPAPIALVLLLVGQRLLPRELTSLPARPRRALFRNSGLRHAALGAASLNGTYQSFLVLVTFQVADDNHWSPWQTALGLLPACVPLMLTVPFAGRLVERHGTGRLIALGAAFPLVGYLLYLARPDPRPYVTGLLPALLLVEAGFCCAFAALNMQATSSIAVADRGAAVALYQTCVQLGSGLLLPLVVLLRQAQGLRPALAAVTAVAAAGLVAALSHNPHNPHTVHKEDGVG
jgi:MFS family permease